MNLACRLQFIHCKIKSLNCKNSDPNCEPGFSLMTCARSYMLAVCMYLFIMLTARQVDNTANITNMVADNIVYSM